MDEAHQRLHAVVRGRVQGVYFRQNTGDQAARLGLSGWVRNRPDGSVEVLAEGTEAALQELLAYLRRGPPEAWVTGVQADWSPGLGEFRDFDVRW